MCEFGLTDVHVAQKQVIDSVSFDVHMVHDVAGHHYIERITQIIPAQKEDRYELRDIVVFDTEKKEYRFVGEIFPSAPSLLKEAAG